MPLTDVDFNVTQDIALPSILTLVDASGGDDTDVVIRQVTLQKADGTPLVPDGVLTDYIEWDASDPVIDIDVLNRDYGLFITVKWLDADGNQLYIASRLYAFTLYTQEFYFGLTQFQTSNPRVINDRGYYENKLKLLTCIDEATNAAELGGDIYSIQGALDRAFDLIRNISNYF